MTMSMRLSLNDTSSADASGAKDNASAAAVKNAAARRYVVLAMSHSLLERRDFGDAPFFLRTLARFLFAVKPIDEAAVVELSDVMQIPQLHGIDLQRVLVLAYAFL